jgi:non-heme chloroperoxidase
MQCGFNAAYECIKAFSETDFTADLKKFDVPTLVLHGDADQIVLIGASAMLSSKLLQGSGLQRSLDRRGSRVRKQPSRPR